MNPKPSMAPAGPAISARDIYYVLFRYKWMITIIAGIGIAGSVILRQYFPIYYSSEARLLIKYVLDTKPLTAEGADTQVTSLNNGETILNAEIEMLTSLDVCKQVASLVGASKILPQEGLTNEIAAALVVQRGLIPSRERNSDVIRIYYTSVDRDLVQPVLTQVISAYEAEHDEVRRPKSSDKLGIEIDSVRGKVHESEKRLLDERTNYDIISLEDSKKNVAARIQKTEDELNDLQIKMQVQAMTLGEMRKSLPPGSLTNAPATNQMAETPPAIAVEYRKDGAILASLQGKELDMLTYTTTNNPELRSIETQIANMQARCRQLAEKYPGLVAIKAADPGQNDPVAAYYRERFSAEVMTVMYQQLTNRLAQAKQKQQAIAREEGSILDLERESERDRANLDYFQKRQSETEINGLLLEPGSSQISVIESPTPPSGDFVKVDKICAGVLFGGLFLALALPFVIEFYLDQTLKRPADIQNRLGVPFFVSMPKLTTRMQRGALPAAKTVPLLPANGSEDLPPDPSAPDQPGPPPAAPAPAMVAENGHIAPWEQRHALRTHFETLRDRLMTYFEVINLTHKPKLVAVTSCGEGAGVTTTAAGLASSLSETGDGNVLLVNMNVQDGEAHHFYRGKLTCGLEEALERDKRNAACIQENLFVAKDQEVNQNLPRVLPKRFSHLVPKMRASDYDYIIFDMPPMSQISITPRLARYMDMVLLVVESEKTDRDAAKRATDLLLESKTNVGVVLNKSRSHLPRRLQQDI